MDPHHPAHDIDNRSPRERQLPLPMLIVRKDKDDPGGEHEGIAASLEVKNFLLGEGGWVGVGGEGVDEAFVDADVVVGDEDEAGGGGYEQGGHKVDENADEGSEEWVAAEEADEESGHGHCGLGS